MSISSNSVEHKSFVFTQSKCQTVLFDPWIGPYQMLLLQTRMDLGAIALQEPNHQIVYFHVQDTR